jgi:hypothetical protein
VIPIPVKLCVLILNVEFRLRLCIERCAQFILNWYKTTGINFQANSKPKSQFRQDLNINSADREFAGQAGAFI